MNMPSILIKNIGAIKNSGKLLLSPVTVFCGKQGSGKSTVAKLISTITENNKDFSQLKGVLKEQQAELNSKFGIVESHTISNKPIGYSWYVVLYLLLGVVLGFVLAVFKTEISKAVKKAKILSEQESNA